MLFEFSDRHFGLNTAQKDFCAVFFCADDYCLIGDLGRQIDVFREQTAQNCFMRCGFLIKILIFHVLFLVAECANQG